MAEDGEREVEYQYRTEKVIRGREGRTIADWQNRGWEFHAQDKGALRTTLTFRQVVAPSRFKPWMGIAALLAVGVLGLGGTAIAEALGSDDSPEATDTSSQTAATPTEKASEEGSEQPTPTPSRTPSDSSIDEVLTVKNNPDLKTLLISDEDYALSKAFAKTYKGRTIAFDGSIANAMGSTYLVYAGDNSDTEYVPGPAFQFRGLEVDGGRARAGDNLRFVATVGTFKAPQGLFTLTSVSAKPR